MENWLRLIDTFRFFNEMPLIGNTRWLQEWLGMDNSQLSSASIPPPFTQTQNVWLLQIPIERRYALARDLQKVGMTIKTLDSPLSSSTIWENGRSLLWWDTAVDGLDLAQAISTLQKTWAYRTFPLFQFQEMTAPQLAEMWGAVDDVVMGGVSASGLRHCNGYAQFSGRVSTQNSGGFASVRTRNFDPPYDWGEWQGLRLQVRGDGQRYKLILRDRPAWDGAAYCGSFDTEKGQWQTIEIPFSDLIATFRARTLANARPLNSTQVCALQLMLSKFEYDGQLNPRFQPGAFALDIRDISVYQSVSLPPLIAIANSTSEMAQYESLLASSGLAYKLIPVDEPKNGAQPDREDSVWITKLLEAIADSKTAQAHQ